VISMLCETRKPLYNKEIRITANFGAVEHVRVLILVLAFQ
jgi:hypothetical protein